MPSITATAVPPSERRSVSRRLVWVVPVMTIATVLANVVIRTLAVAAGWVPYNFVYLEPPMVVGATIVLLMLASAAFVIVERFARQPVRFYRRLAVLALLVSLLDPAMARAGMFPTADVSYDIFWTMLTMHVVSAAIATSMLTTLAVRSRPESG